MWYVTVLQRVLQKDEEEVQHEFIYSVMQLDLTWEQWEEGAETSLFTGLLSVYQANVGVTLCFLLPFYRMGSSTITYTTDQMFTF